MNSNVVKKRIQWMFFTAVALPPLCLLLINPGWLARLVAVLSFSVITTFLFFYYGFHPKSEFIYNKSKIAKQGSEKVKRNARRVIRCLTILFAFFFLFAVTIPLFKDGDQIARNREASLLNVRGRVVGNNFLFGTYFFKQGILVTKDGKLPAESYTAVFFPRLLRLNKTYWFLVAPKSGLVLDWQDADDSETPPVWQ